MSKKKHNCISWLKKNLCITGIILFVSCILYILMDSLAVAYATDTYSENFSGGGATTYSDAIDQSYILAYEMDQVMDGTAPFDADDAAGNDSNDSNGIVRTFDYVNYTLKYTTAIKDTVTEEVTGANVMVEFQLPCDPSEAEFNTETMNWCLDMVITYEYEDGSTSTAWNKNKRVVNQKLTGKRMLVNGDAGNVIPGTGTLSTGI